MCMKNGVTAFLSPAQSGMARICVPELRYVSIGDFTDITRDQLDEL